MNGIVRTSVDLGGIWIERWTVVGGMPGGLEGLYEMLLSRSAIIAIREKGSVSIFGIVMVTTDPSDPRLLPKRPSRSSSL